ncbi:MAG: DNA polymerase I [Clostridia bacterium]|nr:DNA polymerase I [Clostridia bacterium]
MNFLVIDGNSFLFRAFYGIKLLTAKDGHYTNAIFGFMNIFLSLIEQTNPEAVAVAFDTDKPTFRHNMFDGYKAGRKKMPPELAEQIEPLKKILRAYGCTIIECPGFEADDILGTLSHSYKDGKCYVATGDRDSLQIVSDNVSVLLTTTKLGKTHTVEYTPAVLLEEYGLTPSEMIELKALQGDNSDNIPGVAGIGPKTAGELIKKYKSIEAIYENIDALEATASVKNKLVVGKENAFLSKTLGTINLSAPIETDVSAYLLKEQDKEELKNQLAYHEMFKLLSRLGLDKNDNGKKIHKDELKSNITLKLLASSDLVKVTADCEDIFFTALFAEDELKAVGISDEKNVYIVENTDLFFMSAVSELLKNKSIKKYVCNAKELYKYCFLNSIELNNVVFDTTLAAYLLNPNTSDFSLNVLALSYNIPFAELTFSDDEAKVFFEENTDFCNNAAVLMLLSRRLEALINDNNQQELLSEIEIPLAKVLSSMEIEGIAVDTKGIEDYSKILEAKAKELEAKVFELAGEKFNINSPKQLGVILFEKLNLPGKKKTKSGYSTSADVLEGLADDYPIVSYILEYRTFSKLKSTYCDGLIKAVEADGRIRTTFNQTETKTGRLSSTEPNLQNIPVRTAVGREFRKFFKAKEGYCIVDADYSQIELRVLAAIADDNNMIEAFNSNTDIHSVTASKVFGVPLEEITSELRSKAKAVNFGIVYGIGAFSLSKDIKTTRSEAESFIKSYLSLYSGVDKYMKECIVSAKENGYVETLLHRRRYLPELSSSNGMIRAFGERVARNMPIQGTAADIIKLAMIKVYDELAEKVPEARLIMQVHDELMVECPENKAQEVCEILVREMENAIQMKVKLSVEAAVGKTWYEAKG